MAEPFRVGVTRDFIRPDGSLGFGGHGVGLLSETPGIEMVFMPEHPEEFRPQDVAGFDAIGMLGGRVTPATLEGNERLTLIARFGVGYDNVDVAACTRQRRPADDHARRRAPAGGGGRPDLPAGARQPAARSKDRLTRAGRWADKLDASGIGLTGRTLGIDRLRQHRPRRSALAKPLEMRHIAYDPYADPASGRGARRRVGGPGDAPARGRFRRRCLRPDPGDAAPASTPSGWR